MRMSIENFLTSVFVRALLTLRVKVQHCSRDSRLLYQEVGCNNK